MMRSFVLVHERTSMSLETRVHFTCASRVSILWCVSVLCRIVFFILAYFYVMCIALLGNIHDACIVDVDKSVHLRPVLVCSTLLYLCTIVVPIYCVLYGVKCNGVMCSVQATWKFIVFGDHVLIL